MVILTDEYIIEVAKTPRFVRQVHRSPQNFSIDRTFDGLYFEIGPLDEGWIYAFRGRAKNSAGYGGYSEIWIVEVV